MELPLNLRSHVIALGLVLPVLLAPAGAAAQQVTGDEVRLAVAAAVKWLQRAQLADGRWPEYRQPGGTTALATLALLNADVPPDQDGMRRALEAVRQIPLQHTYVTALKIQALAAADPRRYRAEIQAAADWLAGTQRSNGMWGYGADGLGGHTDFSNSQFALLGLHEAQKAGARIQDQVWRLAERAWIQAQLPDGGWGYIPQINRSTGSMTAAGLASLYITGNSLSTRSEAGFADGQAPRCGRYSEFRPLARGLAWLAKNYSAQRNPADHSWYFYYMYTVERVGILSGLRYYGAHDWYRTGAAELIRRQRPTGQWEENNAVVDTAFGVIFLAKGHRPVLFQKLQWSDDARWNLDRNDIAHLVAFVGDRMGGPFGWQVVSLRADVQDWLTAPILYFNGHEFPRFTEDDIARLADFVAQGGTLLAEACCGRQNFRDGFVAFAREAFPEYELSRLPAHHPVFRSLFSLDGESIELHGITAGCRTSVFYSPHDLSCLWEQANIPRLSQAAFELGTNIAAYATGLEPLPDKLDVVRVAQRARRHTERETPPRGAVYIAQLMHSGDWRPDPRAIPNLSDYLYEKMGVDVVRQYQPLLATDPRLAQHPIVYMTGHFTFELSTGEIDALRRHLERGGMLLADACCGRKPFDIALRRLAAQLFPDHPLERLPPDHPIITGSPGVALPRVTYRPAVVAEEPNLREVVLEAVTLDGRTAIVYSPYAIGCPIDGHTCHACRGLVPEDARQLAANIILHALSY
jgi:hypothetical protein